MHISSPKEALAYQPGLGLILPCCDSQVAASQSLTGPRLVLFAPFCCLSVGHSWLLTGSKVGWSSSILRGTCAKCTPRAGEGCPLFQQRCPAETVCTCTTVQAYIVCSQHGPPLHSLLHVAVFPAPQPFLSSSGCSGKHWYFPVISALGKLLLRL